MSPLPSDDEQGLSPELEERLRRQLDRVQPLHTSPRYATVRKRAIALRLAPAAIAVTLLSLLALSAYAETGSPNPVVWSQRVVTVVAPPKASPTSTQVPPAIHHESPTARPSKAPEHPESPQPSERPEPTESPEPRESPEPSGSPEAGSDSSGGTTSDSGGDERS